MLIRVCSLWSSRTPLYWTRTLTLSHGECSCSGFSWISTNSWSVRLSIHRSLGPRHWNSLGNRSVRCLLQPTSNFKLDWKALQGWFLDEMILWKLRLDRCLSQHIALFRNRDTVQLCSSNCAGLVFKSTERISTIICKKWVKFVVFKLYHGILEKHSTIDRIEIHLFSQINVW